MAAVRRHALAIAVLLAVLAGRASADGRSAAVDKLFARWNHADTPGCAVAVIRDGSVVYKRGFGSADLEYRVPITPSTVFHVASVSKQFTAFCVLLLASDGKLSLDDDVRKYLPELHDFGKTITIRHLLRHTSGLRDQWSLVSLAGWRMQDIITQKDVLDLVWRQRELNFDPGAAHLYSNTGYTLAAEIVQRVSDMPFAEFAMKRLFEPLGMKHTHFHMEAAEVVPGRAYSYYRDEKGILRNAVLSYSNAGATSLFTTVEDLALWDRNFYDPRVGDAKLIASMQETSKLNGGQPLNYGFGLQVGAYRGLATVEHGGADAGFRSDILRFPSEKTTVILLSNDDEFDSGGMARRVADVYLKDRLEPAKAAPPPAAKRAEVHPPAATLDAYVGVYRVAPGMEAEISREGDGLFIEPTGQDKTPMFASAEREFFLKVADVQVTFAAPENGHSPSFTLKMDGRDMVARRVERHALTADQLAEYAGDYHSPELGVLYTISVKDGRLTLRHPRTVLTLKPLQKDAFAAGGPIGAIRFQRNTAGHITGFRVTDGRVRNLRFDRVTLVPVG